MYETFGATRWERRAWLGHSVLNVNSEEYEECEKWRHSGVGWMLTILRGGRGDEEGEGMREVMAAEEYLRGLM